MNLLFFDTETIGLPKDYKAPVTDVDNWPRMVQLAWIFVGADTRTFSALIKPDGFTIPEEVTAIHGITNERAEMEGMTVIRALDSFSLALADADLLVGHNISFDRKIVGAEMIRAGREDSLHGRPRICTMQKSTRYCDLPGKYGPKWPKLEELYMKLFGVAIEGSHDAAADIEATAKCFFGLRRLGVITDKDLESAMNPKIIESF